MGEGETGVNLAAFTDAINSVADGLKGAVTELAPIMGVVAVAALIIYLVPWGIRKLRQAFGRAS